MSERSERNVLLDTERADSAQLEPSSDLKPLIVHHWTARWDFPDPQRRTVRVLTDACAHLVIERGASRVVGLVRGVFDRELTGQGVVVGIKLRVGGLRHFSDRPASEWTDRRRPLEELFGGDASRLEAEVLALQSLKEQRGVLEDFVRPRRISPGKGGALVERALERLRKEPALRRVETLADKLGVSRRTLVRTFSEVVGASPKWFIRRERILEAARRIQAGGEVSMTELAQDLEYFDQAHFSRDFAATVGLSPGNFARRWRI